MVEQSLLFFRSFLFMTGLVIYTLLFGPFCLIVCYITLPFMSFEKRFSFITSWIDVIMKWLSITCNISFEVKGLENIPDKPCVVIANHQSTWETFYTYKLFKPQVTMLKQELLWIPVFGWGLKLLKPIAINRSKKRQALKMIMSEAPKAINNGFWYVAYPEGTRVPVDTHVAFASGSSLIACGGGFNVLPVAHNAGYCWPGKRFLKYPGKITLSIGPVISSADKDARALTREVELWIRKEQQTLGSGF